MDNLFQLLKSAAWIQGEIWLKGSSMFSLWAPHKKYESDAGGGGL